MQKLILNLVSDLIFILFDVRDERIQVFALSLYDEKTSDSVVSV